ncbi:hypothetical protein EMPG_09827 [Blastomyces silverae]|uniref:Uncharacterized protein n=1 Tax=Blastomyces silverae TaxID=2060906 RepID=A0A0H1BHV2_9EURO|nr:hypothetical protein EMPG_09827 [Blastomyces silverae]
MVLTAFYPVSRAARRKMHDSTSGGYGDGMKGDSRGAREVGTEVEGSRVGFPVSQRGVVVRPASSDTSDAKFRAKWFRLELRQAII